MSLSAESDVLMWNVHLELSLETWQIMGVGF